MRLALLFSVVLLASAPSLSLAAWPHDPSVGFVPVCRAIGAQADMRAVSDGAGGAIIVWDDQRGGVTDIYAQRVNAAGLPLWTLDGVPVCVAVSGQQFPALVADGAGGAIITWEDFRAGTGSTDVYAQRLNSSGAPVWAVNGVVVCNAANYQQVAIPASDGANGAIVTWQDQRSGTSNDIYAQRIAGANGASLWTANGIVVCNATLDQRNAGCVPDGAGGVYVAWDDFRNGSNRDIYAQHVLSGGTLGYVATGLAICTQVGDQSVPAIAADGIGGAIVTWADGRTGVDVYAQRINSAGTQWLPNGVPVSVAANSQFGPVIAGDGAGGAFIAWYDGRGSTYDIYAQHLNNSGAPLWTVDGLALCTAAGDQNDPAVVADGSGGAIVCWYDPRYSADVFAQRVSGAGATQWLFNGAAVSMAPSFQEAAVPVSDGAGGAIFAYLDYQAANFDVSAQRIERYGQLGNPEPVIMGAKDLPNDQGGVLKLSWTASYLDVDPVDGIFDYRVWRSLPPNVAALRVLRNGATSDPDAAAASGRVLVGPYSAQGYAWEPVGTVSAGLLPAYSLAVSTLQDSVGAGNPRTAFMVEGRNSTSVTGDHWYSAPDSGYSVDNLPPVAPAPFTAQYAAGTTALHWNRNTEADLAGYRLYRGTSVAFTPGPASLVAVLPDSGFADAAGAPYVYKLTAVDQHGNESPVATVVPSGTTGVDPGAALELSLAAPQPNPAFRATTLRLTLPARGSVRLAIYDAAGRSVRVLASGEREPGSYAIAWDLTDGAGQAAPAGLYFARLEAGGRTFSRRLAVTR